MPLVDPPLPPSRGPELTLDEASVDPDPLRQFQLWYNDAVAAAIERAEAMTLATTGADGQPTARIVLLRGVDERGFVFFTNYESDKGHGLAANPRAALVFFWEKLDRQVRVQGRVEKTSAEESDSYFARRPRGSRIAAWASPQSQVLAGRAALEQQVKELEQKFAGQELILRPPNWGGFRVIPDQIEFWHGRPNRLHDRIRYRRHSDGSWLRERLAP